MSAEIALIDPLVLWADEHGQCCDCCAGYCPRFEGGGLEDDLYDMVVLDLDGTGYVGNRYILVRSDRVGPIPEQALKAAARPITIPEWATVPDKMPAEFTEHQSANILDRVDRAGLTVHAGDDKIVHLYQGQQHVGWTTLLSPGKRALACDPADLDLVRRIAIATDIALPAAEKALRLARGGAE